MTEKIGQMDQGYFVSRSDIVRWVNHTLELEITDVEQLGTGAIYCQLFDCLYQGRVPMNKVNWRAKQEYEFLQNFKLLQGVLDRLGIDKKIDVPKLVKCKCQDNLELIQWVKRYIELQGGPEQGYDPIARRGKVFVELPIVNTKRKGIANKQNMMKKSAFLSTSTCFKPGTFSAISGKSSAKKSDSPNHLDLTNLNLNTPIRGGFNLAHQRRIMSKTQRNPLKAVHMNDSNKLNLIRTIIHGPTEEREQRRQIKRLLTSEDILEEEEFDFI